MITNFFTELNQKFKDDLVKFPNPDPDAKDGNKELNFCAYWKQSWQFAGLQVIPNPAPQTDGMKDDKATRRPIDWIAAAYPFTQVDKGGPRFANELPLLQKLINNPAKNNVSDFNINNNMYPRANLSVYRCSLATS